MPFLTIFDSTVTNNICNSWATRYKASDQPELPLRSSYCFIEHGNWPSLCGCFRVSTRHVFTHMLQVEARHVMTNICRLQESHEYATVDAHEYSSVGECHQIILIYCAIPSCSSVCMFLSIWFLFCFVPLSVYVCWYVKACSFWCTGQQWTVMYSPKCSHCVETVLCIQDPHIFGGNFHVTEL